MAQATAESPRCSVGPGARSCSSLGETALLVAAVIISSILIVRHPCVGPADRQRRHPARAVDRRGLPDLPALCRISTICAPSPGTRDLLVRLLRAIGATSLILGIAYWLFPLWMIEPRRVPAVGGARGLAGDGVASPFDWLTTQLAPRERLLLVGTSPAAVVLARELFERRQELGVDIVGFVDPDPARVGAPVINPGVVGTIDDIPGLTARMRVDRVVVSLSDERGKLPMDQLLDVRLQSGVLFDHLASVYEEYTGKIALENLRPSWLVFSTGFRKSRLLMADQARVRLFAAVCRPGARLAADGGDRALILKLESPSDPVSLSPGARRPERPRVHHPQVPHHAHRRRGRDRPGVEHRRNDTRMTAGRPLHAQDAARRDPAAVERPDRRHEPDRAAARAAGVRRAADGEDSVLRPAPRHQAGCHRMGAGALQLRRQRRRRDREDAVPTSTTSRTCR